MIKYKRNIIDMMAEKGITTYLIRKNKIFTESQLQQLRNDRLVTQDTLNKICTILECQPGYLLEYLPDETTKDFEEKILTYINKKCIIKTVKENKHSPRQGTDQEEKEYEN